MTELYLLRHAHAGRQSPVVATRVGTFPQAHQAGRVERHRELRTLLRHTKVGQVDPCESCPCHQIPPRSIVTG